VPTEPGVSLGMFIHSFSTLLGGGKGAQSPPLSLGAPIAVAEREGFGSLTGPWNL
jgi:hypothetical protein